MSKILIILLGSYGLIGLITSIYYIITNQSEKFLYSTPFFIKWLINIGVIPNRVLIFQK